MGYSINLSQEPTKIQTRCTKAQRTTHMYIMCKPTYNQFGDTTYTNTCKEQNQNMQRASNFQCKQFKYKLPQGGTLDIRYNLDDSIDLAWDNKSDEVPLILHNVAKSPMPSNNTYWSVWACWSPTKLGPKRLVTIGLATQMVLFLTPLWVPTTLANTLPTLSFPRE